MSEAPTVVLLRSRSALVLSEQVTFEFGDSTCVAQTAVEDAAFGEGVVPEGLVFALYIDAESADAAFEKSTAQVAFVVNILTLTHSAEIEQPEPLIAYDLDPLKPDRQFVQGFRDIPLDNRPVRALDPQLVRAFFEHDLVTEESPQGEAFRRSLDYLRFAVSQSSLLARFLYEWAGLESINELLCIKYDLPRNYTGSPCGNCGNQRQIPGGTQGVKRAVTEMRPAAKQGDWKLVRDLRNDFLHGSNPFDEQRLRAASTVTHEALIAGLLDLLGVEAGEERGPYLLSPLPISKTFRLKVTGRVLGVTPDQLKALPTRPSVEPVRSRNEQADIVLSGGLRFRRRISGLSPEKVVIDRWEVGLPVDPDSQQPDDAA